MLIESAVDRKIRESVRVESSRISLHSDHTESTKITELIFQQCEFNNKDKQPNAARGRLKQNHQTKENIHIGGPPGATPEVTWDSFQLRRFSVISLTFLSFPG